MPCLQSMITPLSVRTITGTTINRFHVIEVMDQKGPDFSDADRALLAEVPEGYWPVSGASESTGALRPSQIRMPGGGWVPGRPAR